MPTRAVGSVPGRNHQDKKNNKEEQQDTADKKKNKKGHAQHIAFVLQFGKFCGLNRMFLNGDSR
jgi:hypothetical protein